MIRWQQIITLIFLHCSALPVCCAELKTLTTPILSILLAHDNAEIPKESLIFEDTFDGHPDWTMDDIASTGNKYNVPAGWTVGRTTPRWSPAASIDPTSGKHPTGEILALNSDKAYGTTGKSFVSWRDSYAIDGQNNFNSDSILLKVLPRQYSELYIECMVTFSNEMVSTYYNHGIGQSKLMRTLYIDLSTINGDPNQYFQFFDETNSPKALVDIAGGQDYGIRNFLALYAKGDNDLRGIIQGVPPNFQLHGSGDLSLSYSANGTAGADIDGSSADLIDHKNGGYITSNPVHIDQVFGDETIWKKMALYVKMNSAPGVEDGVVMQWLDGERVSHLRNIPWVRQGHPMVGWNVVAIGGNDFFRAYPNEDKYQEWYAIDNFRVYDAIPDGVDY